MVGLMEAGMEVVVGRYADNAMGLVSCRELPEHFLSDDSDDTQSHRFPFALLLVGSSWNWSDAMIRLWSVVHAAGWLGAVAVVAVASGMGNVCRAVQVFEL